MDDIAKLAERVEAGSGWDSSLDKAVLRALGYSWRGMDYWHDDEKTIWKGQTCFTASLDASVALLERVLPGAAYVLNVFDVQRKPERVVHAKAHVSDVGLGSGTIGAATSPARALLAATLRALADGRG